MSSESCRLWRYLLAKIHNCGYNLRKSNSMLWSSPFLRLMIRSELSFRSSTINVVALKQQKISEKIQMCVRVIDEAHGPGTRRWNFGHQNYSKINSASINSRCRSHLPLNPFVSVTFTFNVRSAKDSHARFIQTVKNPHSAKTIYLKCLLFSCSSPTFAKTIY